MFFWVRYGENTALVQWIRCEPLTDHHIHRTCVVFFSIYGMNGVTQRVWSFLLLLWGLSDPRIAELREMPQSFIIKLYSETQVSGRLGMSGGISPRHAQNPLSGERRKTLSITHHALSPPPSHHHLYIIQLINWLQRFYRIRMSLKRPFVPKSDVKQFFTTKYIYLEKITTFVFSDTIKTHDITATVHCSLNYGQGDIGWYQKCIINAFLLIVL